MWIKINNRRAVAETLVGSYFYSFLTLKETRRDKIIYFDYILSIATYYTLKINIKRNEWILRLDYYGNLIIPMQSIFSIVYILHSANKVHDTLEFLYGMYCYGVTISRYINCQIRLYWKLFHPKTNLLLNTILQG